MKLYLNILLIFALAILYSSCKKNKETIDQEKPKIDLSIVGAFPKSCDTLYLGDTIIFKALFTDNEELGSFNINIHHNFDHHSHTTEVTECLLEPIKTPVNPFLFIQDYSIPYGKKSYEVNLPIFIPASNNNGNFDTGDYHFYIMLTDKSGWSTQKGISIKISKRK